MSTHTAEEFAAQAKKHNITEWAFRQCWICGYSIYYLFHSDGVRFNPGCGCSDSGHSELRSWQDVANHYNRQTHPDTIAEMDAFWRWGTP